MSRPRPVQRRLTVNTNLADFVQCMKLAPESRLVCLVNEAGEMYAVFDLLLGQADAERRAAECSKLMPEGDMFSCGDVFGVYTARGFLRLLEEPEDFNWNRAEYINLREHGACYTLCGLPSAACRAWENAA